METWILSFMLAFAMACLCAGSIVMAFSDLLMVPFLASSLGWAMAAMFLLGEGLLVRSFVGTTQFSPLWWCFSFWIGVFALGLIVLSIHDFRKPPRFPHHRRSDP